MHQNAVLCGNGLKVAQRMAIVFFEVEMRKCGGKRSLKKRGHLAEGYCAISRHMSLSMENNCPCLSGCGPKLIVHKISTETLII